MAQSLSPVGSLIMVGFDDVKVTPQVVSLIEEHRVGCILLSAKNFSSAAQAKSLIAELQDIARRSGHTHPILIATDQENGCVNSIYDAKGITQFPSAMGMSKTGLKTLVRDVARATGKELTALGVNWILGPVLDVLATPGSLSLGVRTLGENPEEVRAYSLEFIKGYQESGLATCGKHFPSFGKLEFPGLASGMPVISETLEELRKGTFIPFRQGILTGLDAIMIGACPTPRVGESDTSLACLSPYIIKDLLREELSFCGIVLSECLEVETLHDLMGVGQATVMALSAGCDMVNVCSTFQSQLEAISAIKTAIDSGIITVDQVNASARRISQVKAKWTSWDSLARLAKGNHIERLFNQHQDLSALAYKRSVTIFRDKEGVLPLSKKPNSSQYLVLFTPLIESIRQQAPRPNKVSQFRKVEGAFFAGENTFHELGLSLARDWPGKVLHSSYSASGFQRLHEDLLSKASIVIIVTAEAVRNTYQFGFTRLVMALADAKTYSRTGPKTPCIVMSVSSPYDFLHDANVPTYICTYDYSTSAFEAATSLIFQRNQRRSNSNTGDLSEGSRPPLGSYSNKYVQPWLVEQFVPQRDSLAAQEMLSSHGQAKDCVGVAQLVKCDFKSHLPFHAFGALVVRNSSTRAILGLCVYSILSSANAGGIDTIIVDYRRRRSGIGTSLYRRAIDFLLQQNNVTQVYFGPMFPLIFPSLPLNSITDLSPNSYWGWPDRSESNSRSITLTLKVTELEHWQPAPFLSERIRRSRLTFSTSTHGLKTAVTEYVTSCLNSPGEVPTEIVRSLYLYSMKPDSQSEVLTARDSLGEVFASCIVYQKDCQIETLFPVVEDCEVAVIGSLYSGTTEMGDFLALTFMHLRSRKYSSGQITLFDVSLDEQTRANLNLNSCQEFSGPIFRRRDEVHKHQHNSALNGL